MVPRGRVRAGFHGAVTMTARILVVDDIAANLRLLEAKLLDEYYEVALAASGPEALAKAARWAPDVILLDVMMPGMDGYEVCRRLKANSATAHIPVVMVTALVDPAERVRGLEAGADDFLSKPVDDADAVRPAARPAAGEAGAGCLAAALRDRPRPRLRAAARIRRPASRAPRVLVLSEMPAEAGLIAGRPRRRRRGGAGRHRARTRRRQVLAEGNFDLAVLCLPRRGRRRAAPRLPAAGPGARRATCRCCWSADASQRGLVLRGFDLGANDHVLRPIDPNELRARARNQIRRKRYQERLRADLDRSLEMAVTDPLTGLRNRRYVRRHLEGVLRGRMRRCCCWTWTASSRSTTPTATPPAMPPCGKWRSG